jgi:hypothetical protein
VAPPHHADVGFTDQISPDELGHLDQALTAALAAVEPPAVEFWYLTIQREAVYLKAHPAAALYPLRRTMQQNAVAGDEAVRLVRDGVRFGSGHPGLPGHRGLALLKERAPPGPWFLAQTGQRLRVCGGQQR